MSDRHDYRGLDMTREMFGIEISVKKKFNTQVNAKMGGTDNALDSGT